jgi:septum formation protein
MNLLLPVVLASASPRRKELLSTLIDDFEVLVSEVDEDALTSSDPWRTAEELSLAKAVAVAQLRPDALVIGGDTVVAIKSGEGYEQLAKPLDAADAERMLRRLSGETHVVITGVSLVWSGGRKTFSATSSVMFRELSGDEIRAYVDTGEPMDKAGAYAIQGGAAGFVAHLEGSLTNVIGLPVEMLKERWPTPLPGTR